MEMEDDGPLFVPYSRRNFPDDPSPFVLQPIPSSFKSQLVHIFNRVLGESLDGEHGGRVRWHIWKRIGDKLAEESGEVSLANVINARSHSYFSLVVGYITYTRRSEDSPLPILDAIEIFLRECSLVSADNLLSSVDNAEREINQRLRQHRLAYQVQNGLIIRVDSQYIHRQVVRPAFHLLQDARFDVAEKEFLQAHDDYLDGHNRKAMAGAHNTVESVLKAICNNMGWKYAPADGTKRLIDIVIRERQLVPALVEYDFKQWALAFENTATKVGNPRRHGAGSTEDIIPDSVAAYGLHTAAANIVLIVSAYLELKAGSSA